MRIAFFGTPAVAVPSLLRLVESRHDVVCVVSQPDRGRGRGRKRTPSPVAGIALDAGIPLIRPERVGEADTLNALEATTPDIGVVLAFGQFIPKRVRGLPSRGYLINAHASLLPRYRGASPIAQAILDGETETGISVMRVEKEMDAGPVAHMLRTPIDPQENTAELTDRLAELAADALARVLDQIEDGSVRWTAQDASRATLAPKLEKADGRLDWRKPSDVLVREVHGYAPRPGAFTRLPASPSKPRAEAEVLRILRARVDVDADAPRALPGTVRLGQSRDEPALRIATGDGWLEALEVQRAGGKALASDAFLRGYAIETGCVLDAVPDPAPDSASQATPDPALQTATEVSARD